MSEQGDLPSKKELVTRLKAHSNRFDYLEDKLEDARGEREALRAEVKELHEENEALREELNQLDERTDLLQLVQSSDELTAEQRSVALVQHLRRAAERQRDRGRDAKASVTRREAERALQFPDVDRTTIYTDMRRAVKLVGDENLLWYVGTSGGESRLKLNLESGELAARFRTNGGA